MNLTYKAFQSKRKFGVEIEVNRHLTQQRLVQLVDGAMGKHVTEIEGWGYTCGNKYWVVKPDSSCGDQGNKDFDGGGYEVASAVGAGSKHLLKIEKVTQGLANGGAIVNKFCGFHCQVEIKDFTDEEAAMLLAYWMKIENVISHSVPSHRITSKHCKFFTKHKKKFPLVENMTDANEFWKVMKLKTYEPKDKRTTITLINYHRTKSQAGQWYDFHRPTVELRLPEGTVNDFDIKNWSRLFVHFVESCKGRSFPNGVKPVGLEEALEILGLRDFKSFAILSPGLFETKAWFLYRIYTYARNYRMRQAAIDCWKAISLPGMKWRYKFSQVPLPDAPINLKSDNVSVKQQPVYSVGAANGLEEYGYNDD